MGVTLAIFFSGIVAQTVMDAEEFEQSRKNDIKVFESKERSSEKAHRAPFELKNEEEFYKPYEYHFKATTSDELPDKAVAEETAEPQPLSSETKSENSSYFHRLSRALPCFKGFISSLYQARTKRDMKIADCASKNCDGSKATHAFEENSVSITDQFYSCLNESPDHQTASKK